MQDYCEKNGKANTLLGYELTGIEGHFMYDSVLKFYVLWISLTVFAFVVLKSSVASSRVHERIHGCYTVASNNLAHLFNEFVSICVHPLYTSLAGFIQK